MKILFVPTLHYLTDPLFQRVFPALKGKAEIYYITSSEPALNRVNQKYKFTLPDYVKVMKSEVKTSTATGKLLKDSIHLHKYASSILSQIKKIKPDAIIYGSDQTPLIKIIDAKFPLVPKIVIQSALLNHSEEKKQSQKKQKKWYKRLVLDLLNPFIYPLTYKEVPYGHANPEHHLFLFGERTLSLMKNHKTDSKLHLTGYPLVEKTTRSSSAEHILIYLPVASDKKEMQESYNDIFSLMNHFPDEKYILKKHPQANAEDFAELVRKSQHLKIIAPEDLTDLNSSIKGVVSFYSFGDYPYLLNDIPMIFHRRKYYSFHDFWFGGLDLPRSKDDAELISNFQQLLDQKFNKENAAAYLGDMFAETGEKSVDLIASEILRIAKPLTC